MKIALIRNPSAAIASFATGRTSFVAEDGPGFGIRHWANRPRIITQSVHEPEDHAHGHPHSGRLKKRTHSNELSRGACHLSVWCLSPVRVQFQAKSLTREAGR